MPTLSTPPPPPASYPHSASETATRPQSDAFSQKWRLFHQVDKCIKHPLFLCMDEEHFRFTSQWFMIAVTYQRRSIRHLPQEVRGGDRGFIHALKNWACVKNPATIAHHVRHKLKCLALKHSVTECIIYKHVHDLSVNE